MAKHPLLLAAVGCGAVACILQVVGVATPSWVSITIPSPYGSQSITASGGLWKYCRSAGDVTQCDDFEEVLDWVKAVRAFGILAILFMAGAAAVGAGVVLSDNMAGLVVGAAAVSIAGAICSVISFATYAAKAEAGVTFGYSFALCIVGAALAGISGGCFLAGKSHLNTQ